MYFLCRICLFLLSNVVTHIGENKAPKHLAMSWNFYGGGQVRLEYNKCSYRLLRRVAMGKASSSLLKTVFSILFNI